MNVKYKRFTVTNDYKMKYINKQFENDWSMRERNTSKGDTYT